VNVLLTGGAGGVGVHVVKYLLDHTDWHVTVLDSLRHKGDRGRINQFCGQSDRLKVLQHDLVCPISKSLKAEIGEVDYILHLAAISDVGFSVQNPRYTIVNNVESTVTMLDYAAETPHKVFVYFSTDEVYGPTQGPDHAEWDGLRPSNPYAASKAAGELFSYAYWRAGQVKLVIINATNQFGETQSLSKFPAIVQDKLAKGEKITIHRSGEEIGSRCYIHSTNTADALLHILNQSVTEHVQGEIDVPDKYHIVGERLNNLELAELVSELMGKPLDCGFQDCHDGNAAHDVHYSMSDNNLRASGWKPPLSLRESMKRTVEWSQ
jgi:dTDP-glucose 4,6-dehydratase